jgi:hypothetical protein
MMRRSMYEYAELASGDVPAGSQGLLDVLGYLTRECHWLLVRLSVPSSRDAVSSFLLLLASFPFLYVAFPLCFDSSP